MNKKYLIKIAAILAIFFFISSCQFSQKDNLQNTFLKEKQAKILADTSRYNVAFLIMDGVYNTELTAPFDIFQHTQYREGIKAMNVFLVANTNEPIHTFEGIRLLPDFNYLEDELPQIDILVVPSAEHHLDTDLEDAAMIEFVQKVDKTAKFMTSHCDGAFVLAKAGVLEQAVSTTFPSDIGAYRKMFPNLDVREEVLFVHDGKYITSAGGAKSFEAALYLCEYLYGETIAKSLASGLVIDWNLSDYPHIIVKENDEEIVPRSFIHAVYFKVKPNLDTIQKRALLREIEKIKTIDVLRNLEIGEFYDVNDPRALSDYQLTIQMTFDNKIDYDFYQKHEIHQNLKKELQPYLAGPPATYDFWLQ